MTVLNVEDYYNIYGNDNLTRLGLEGREIFNPEDYLSPDVTFLPREIRAKSTVRENMLYSLGEYFPRPFSQVTMWQLSELFSMVTSANSETDEEVQRTLYRTINAMEVDRFVTLNLITLNTGTAFLDAVGDVAQAMRFVEYTPGADLLVSNALVQFVLVRTSSSSSPLSLSLSLSLSLQISKGSLIVSSISWFRWYFIDFDGVILSLAAGCCSIFYKW